ncbi:MAG: hypothetical protein WD669_01295 [Pirellulales bacterium]
MPRCSRSGDRMLQIRNYCRYANRPLAMSPENFDFAVENYFAVMWHVTGVATSR